ncbi:MAG: TIGR04283 family arsenosugar biosynthesis glycosyltransferase [Planctomycetaceae bacterium]|nr:TIGR04283 family arsenosugar biosynthesis glycosyltransferase [Planctomycetaceae bacterium]
MQSVELRSMHVTVIIPALNEEDQVSGTVLSAQQAGADQIVVVDGGSHDDTVAVAQSAGANVIRATAPGRSLQQNLGAREAVGDVLLFLHADCLLQADAVSMLRQHLTDHPAVVGGCFHQMIDDDAWKFRLLEFGNACRVHLLKWIFGDQGLFVRRCVFEELGGFPEDRFPEDLFFSKQLKQRGSVSVLGSRITVSARRWNRRGVLQQTLRNWSIITAAHLGVSAGALLRFYPNDR